MYIVIFISIFAMLLAFGEASGRIKNGLFFGFVLVTILGCIHYNYGNDYMSYYEMYNYNTSVPFSIDYLQVDNLHDREPGWGLLNYIFKYLGGFYMMVAFLNIIQNTIYYRFIKNNVEKKYWGISIMIYLLSTSLYIMNFSMMRQGLSIALFVYAWEYLKEKRFIPSLIIILVASTIHQSAIVLLGFTLLPFLPLSRRQISIIFIVFVITLYLSGQFLNETFESFISNEGIQGVQTLDYYMKTNETVVTYGIGFVINLIPFVIAMWGLFFSKTQIDNQHKLLITLSMFSYIIAPFSQVLPMLGRFGMYFNAYSVAAIPFIYSLLPSKRLFGFLLGIYIMMLVYGYILFFQSPIWKNAYTTFHTIFEVL